MLARYRRAMLPAIMLACAAGPAAASTEADVKNAYILGKAAVNTGYATSYRVRVGVVEIYAPTNSITRARTIADSLCIAARRGMEFEQPFTVQVFTVDGQRPAATCKTG